MENQYSFEFQDFLKNQKMPELKLKIKSFKTFLDVENIEVTKKELQKR